MRTKLSVLLAGIGFLAAGAAMPLQAHHAFAAEFDARKPLKLEGTVTRLQWTNPHTWIYVDVKKSDGTVENWGLEVGTPSVLFRRGFTKDSLKPGTKIMFEGYQARDGSRRANGRDITLPDGRKLFVGSTGIGAPYELTPGSTKSK